MAISKIRPNSHHNNNATAEITTLRNRIEELEQENRRIVDFYESALRKDGNKLDAFTETTLRRSEERFRMSFESGVVGNIVIDDLAIIEEINSQTEAMSGYGSNELIGQNINILMPTDNAGKHDGYIAADLRTNNSKIISARRESVGRRKDGSELPMLLGIGEMILGDRRSFIDSVTDLTDVKILEAKLLHSQKLEAVGQLTSEIFHDFNNLLAVTMANGQLLANELIDNEKLYSMVNSIVSASIKRIGISASPPGIFTPTTAAPRHASTWTLCKGMIALLRRTLGETIKIGIVQASDVWNVSADSGQLENALLNLAINASHAMAGGGNLGIKVSNASVTDRVNR